MSVSIEEISKLSKLVHINLPISLILQIDEYKQNSGKESRTGAIIELIKVGLILQKHKTKLQDPLIKQELQSHYAEGSLVDFVTTMTPRDFELFASIMEDEKRLRDWKAKEKWRQVKQ